MLLVAFVVLFAGYSRGEASYLTLDDSNAVKISLFHDILLNVMGVVSFIFATLSVFLEVFYQEK